MNRTLPARIFICGFMGAGKSTVGQLLADKMEVPFHDLDTYIEKREEMMIPEIFASEGEDAFRRMEKAALLDVIRHQKGVVALGGGTLQNQHILDHIKVNGLLAFIDTPLPMLLERIMLDTDRPLLLDEDGKMKSRSQLQKELTQLMEARRPFYEQAEVTLNGGAKESADTMASILLKKVKYHVALH